MTPWTESLRKTWHKIIHYKVNTRDPTKTEFGESVNILEENDSTHTMEKWFKLLTKDLKKILTEIIQTCIDMNWSDGSAIS